MPALRHTSQAGPMRNPREGTGVMLRDSIRLTWWCVWCVVVARPLLIERCVGLREWSGVERPCAMIFTLLGLWPVFLWRLISTAWWMAIAHAHLTPWAPGSNLAVRVNRVINDRPCIQQEAICNQWFKQRLILSVSKPSISIQQEGHWLKWTSSNPQCLPENLILKAYAAIT